MRHDEILYGFTVIHFAAGEVYLSVAWKAPDRYYLSTIQNPIYSHPSEHVNPPGEGASLITITRKVDS